MKKVIILLMMLFSSFMSWSQCAMCRTQIKNNVSAGESSLAEGLNNGIMFLFFTPYVVVFAIIFLWYRYSKFKKPVSLSDRLRHQ